MAKSAPAYAFGLALAMTAASLPARAADVPVSEEARQHFTAGVTFLQDPDGARYEEALREFQSAYAISPSWKMLGNLGIAAMKLERDGEARDAIRRYLAEGGANIEPDERAQMERDLQALETSVATLHVEATPAGVAIVDERQPVTGSTVVNRYGPLQGSVELGLRPGHHRLTAKLEGYADQVWEVDLQPRSKDAHRFQLVAASSPAARTETTPARKSAVVDTNRPPGNGLRIGSYVALGVGAVGLGLGTVFAIQAQNHYKEGNDLCPSFPCGLTQANYDKRDQAGKDGDSAKTISLVGFVAGGVAVATGVTLFVLSRKSKSEAVASTALYVGPGSLNMAGSF